MRVARVLKRAPSAILALSCALGLVHCNAAEETNPLQTGSSSSSGGGGEGGAGGSGGGPAVAMPHLDPKLPWYGDNRERLDAMIADRGGRSAAYDPAHKPVAIFDWDNTIIKNDVGDATVFWMLLHDKILQPPQKNWALTSPVLTSTASTALTTVCGSLAEPGMPLPTSSNKGCADEILNVYYNGKTTSSLAAFGGYNYRTIEPAYAWAAQLLAGYTPAEVADIADKAITENLAAADDAVQTVGSVAGLNGYIRIYDQMKDLISTLQQSGFDVWVVSASPQGVVEPIAAKVNIKADHVIGIRSVVDQGKLTYNIEGCGGAPDNSLITYIDGKRCWINKVIFGAAGEAALQKGPDDKRQVFAAGDSNTDITFVQDATAMKLVLNRNKSELMCNAYRSYGGRWLINPMFIKPKGKLMTAYPCSTTGCVDKSGALVPCLDEAGNSIPDQADNVY